MAQMTTYNGGPLSLGPIPSGRLKNLKDVDKWSSLSLYLPISYLGLTAIAALIDRSERVGILKKR